MNSTLLGLFGSKKKVQREVRLLVLGLDNAGKTTILKALGKEEINMVMPT
jgi:GTPase SAR1 family protein